MTREEGITVLKSHKAHWQSLLREKICDEIEGGETIEGFDMAISALSDYDKMQKISLDLAFENDELMNKSRWIPVSERLPENNDDVLVYDDSDIFVAWYSGINGNWCSADNRFDEYTPIIAWQPLPEPYKKGGE